MTTSTYKAKDEANERKPVELFRFWTDSGNSNWHYTSGDVVVTLGSTDYNPAYIKREKLAFEGDLKVTRQTLTVARLNPAFVTYLTQPMPEMVWVEISKLFRDQDPYEKRILFIGQVRRSGYDGVDGQIECTGFEKFLKMKIPTMRYQPTCNHKLFSTDCGVTAASYAATVTAIDSISSNGLEITDSALTGDYVGGTLVWGDFKRTITSQSGTTVTIQFYIPDLTAGQDVYVAPGCNKSMSDCQSLYNNLGNPALNRFQGFRYLPKDNPAMWTN